MGPCLRRDDELQSNQPSLGAGTEVGERGLLGEHFVGDFDEGFVVEDAAPLAEDGAVGVDEDGGGHGGDHEGLHDPAVGGGAGGVGDSKVVQEGAGLGFAAEHGELADVYANEEGFIPEILVELLEVGHFGAARGAESGPEVEEDGLALQGGKGQFLAYDAVSAGVHGEGEVAVGGLAGGGGRAGGDKQGDCHRREPEPHPAALATALAAALEGRHGDGEEGGDNGWLMAAVHAGSERD